MNLDRDQERIDFYRDLAKRVEALWEELEGEPAELQDHGHLQDLSGRVVNRLQEFESALTAEADFLERSIENAGPYDTDPRV